jgi:hypothetical protein
VDYTSAPTYTFSACTGRINPYILYNIFAYFTAAAATTKQHNDNNNKTTTTTTMTMTLKTLSKFLQLFCRVWEVCFICNAEPSVRARQQTALCVKELAFLLPA